MPDKEQRKLNSSGLRFRERGEGSLYLPKGCKTYQMRCYDSAGRPRFRSAKTTDLRVAERRLQEFMTDARRGMLPSPVAEKTRISELVRLVIDDYKNSGRKSVQDIEIRANKHLLPFFGEYRASRITSDHITDYIKSRQREKAANATVNRELALLRRAFNLGLRTTPPKVAAQNVPYIRLLAENNVRKGFVEPEQFDRLASECAKVGLWLRCLLQCGIDLGWRSEELRSLTVGQFNAVERTLRLEAGTTKNGDGRESVVSAAAYTYLLQLCSGKKKTDPVFVRDDGSPVKNFRFVWKAVCIKAGLGRLICRDCKGEATQKGRRYYCSTCDRFTRRATLKYEGIIFHDLRRSMAVRYARAGVPSLTVQKIAGWKTPSLHQRYAIRTVEETRTAMQRLEQHMVEVTENARRLREGCPVSGAFAPTVQNSELAN